MLLLMVGVGGVGEDVGGGGGGGGGGAVAAGGTVAVVVAISPNHVCWE